MSHQQQAHGMAARRFHDQFGTLSINALETVHGGGGTVHGYTVLSPSTSHRQVSSSRSQSRSQSNNTSPQQQRAKELNMWPDASLGLHPRRLSNSTGSATSMHDQLTVDRFHHSHATSIASTLSIHQAQRQYNESMDGAHAKNTEGQEEEDLPLRALVEPSPLSPVTPDASRQKQRLSLDKYAASYYLRLSRLQLSQRLALLLVAYVVFLACWAVARAGHNVAVEQVEVFPWWTPVSVMMTVVMLHASKLVFELAPLGGREKVILSCVVCNLICLLAYLGSALGWIPVEMDTRGRRFPPERFCEWLFCTPLLIALVANVSDYMFRADRHMIQVRRGEHSWRERHSFRPFTPLLFTPH
jgi:hypothetical protein